MEKLNMRHLFSKDLGIIFLLTAIYILIISFPNFNYGKFVIDINIFNFIILIHRVLNNLIVKA